MLVVKVPGVNGNKESRNSGNKILSEVSGIINSKGKVINKQLLELEEIHVNNDKLEEQDKLIYENALDVFSEQDKLIFLGGDHSLSYSTISAFLDFSSGFILVFDSCLDLENYEGYAGNKAWLKALIEKYKTENLLIVGATEILGNKEFFQENKIRVVPLQQFTSDLKDTTDFVMESSQGKPLYVSFDMKCVGEEGFSNQQTIYIMKRIAMMRNLKALDIVEVNGKDEKKIKLAAKILAEFL